MTWRWGMLASIFWAFFKMGPVTFGGGYAMLPVIEREVVGNKGWVEEEEMADIVSIAGSAPGGIGVNTAAFIGYRLCGIPGATAAVLGIGLPTFLIIFAFSLVLGLIRDNPLVDSAFKGIHAAIVALIAVAAYKMGRTAIQDKTTLVTAIATVLVLVDFHIHPMLLIIGGLFLGIVLVRVKEHWGMPVPLETLPQTDLHGDYRQLENYYGDGI
ncbi:chromate transporter [Paenibacillus hamazuiensis]|uniref:chromate transporter n=1 Tax=Paenibacillus hamazuiensis TaxID=2936508 RepID=UPI00200E3C9B|nr:chromate transporter [Paenibacillus hamazuiensis]